MPGGIILLIIAIVVISAVVGAIAQFLNKMNEASTPTPRRSKREENEGRKSEKDMDRFLAEIDRLRRKNAEGSEPTAAKPAPPPAQKPKPPQKPVPVARQGRGEKKPKLLAEVVEPTQRRRVDTSAMQAPPAPVAPGTLSPDSRTKPEDLPVATVVGATSSTGAPAATRVTRLATRARPAPKTNLAMNLTGLLNSGQGVAMAIILAEILGPPKAQKPHRSQTTDEPIA